MHSFHKESFEFLAICCIEFIAIANFQLYLGFYMYSVIKIYSFHYHKTTIHYKYGNTIKYKYHNAHTAIH